MNPSRSSFKGSNEGAKVSSNSVIWAGPDLPCIDLCKGDTISDVQLKVATELCKIIEQLDLSETDLGCINDCPACPQPDKSLKKVIKLLIDAFCVLKERVDDLGEANNNANQVFDVNLRCIAQTDGAGNILNDNSNDQIVQSIIDQLCNNKFSIDLLTAKVEDLQDAIDAIPPPPVLELPSLASSCLYTGTRDLDVAHSQLDAAFCSLRSILGLPGALSGGISQQCPDLFTAYGANPNFKATPATVADSLGNMWIVLCDVMSRVAYMESNCCRATCDDVKIGFGVVLSDARDEATLRFTFGNGTSIPDGFIDCGSRLTVTDTWGNVVDQIIKIENAAELLIDLTGLNFNSDYTFSIEVCMRNAETNLTCQKCVTKFVAYQDTCAYCEVSNSGDEGCIIIVYEEYDDSSSSSNNSA